MRFNFSTVSALLAFAASAVAQTPGFDAINVPASHQTITAGTTFTVSWSVPDAYKTGTVTIVLIGGQTQGTQQILSTIATGVPNNAGSYHWAVDASLGGLPVYGLIFRLESDPSTFQYSNPFQIESAATQPTSTSAGDAVTTVTTSAGTQTVILSSVAPTILSAETSIVPITTAVPLSTGVSAPETVIVDVTTTVPCNASTLATSVVAPYSSVVVVPSGGSQPPKANPTSVWIAPSNPPVPTGGSIVTSGAARVGGSIAAIAGLAALLAL